MRPAGRLGRGSCRSERSEWSSRGCVSGASGSRMERTSMVTDVSSRAEEGRQNVTVRRSDIKGYIQERTRGRSEWPSERYLAVRVASRVAAQLDELRMRRGLSYAALASRAGTSKAQVIRLLSGTYDGMTTKSIAKLASALGSEIDVRVRPIEIVRTTPSM